VCGDLGGRCVREFCERWCDEAVSRSAQIVLCRVVLEGITILFRLEDVGVGGGVGGWH
jgi:hypothetical protein